MIAVLLAVAIVAPVAFSIGVTFAIARVCRVYAVGVDDGADVVRPLRLDIGPALKRALQSQPRSQPR